MFKKVMLLLISAVSILSVSQAHAHWTETAIKDCAYLSLGGILGGTGMFIIKYLEPANDVPNSTLSKETKEKLRDVVVITKNTIGSISLLLGASIVTKRCMLIAKRLIK